MYFKWIRRARDRVFFSRHRKNPSHQRKPASTVTAFKHHHSRHSSAALGSCLFFFTSACHNGPPTCKEHAVPISQASANPSPPGTSAASILDLATGVHPVTLAMTTTPDAQGPLSIQPGTASTPGTLTIEPVEGRVAQIESSPSNCRGSACEAQAIECQDRFEAQLRVRLKTQDGTFDESWPAILRVDALPSDTEEMKPGADAVVKLTFPPEQSSGSFSVAYQPSTQGACIKHVGTTMYLKLHFRDGSLHSGQLSAHVTTNCDGYESTSPYPVYSISR